MAAYLGELGNLVKVQCAAELSSTSTRPARYLQTLGGSTFAQVGPRTTRTWDVRLPRTSTPAEIATWRAFVEGEHGLGPWWFVSDIAAGTNLLSPRASVLDHGGQEQGSTSVNGGPMQLSDGTVAPRSWIISPGTLPWLPWDGGTYHVPVVPGVPVTGSVWVKSSTRQQLRAYLYAADGTLLRTEYGPSTDVFPARLTVSTVAQEGEAYMLMRTSASSDTYRIARPAVSWTDSVRPWSVGEGAPMVHVAEMSQDVTLAIPGREILGASFQVREVG